MFGCSVLARDRVEELVGEDRDLGAVLVGDREHVDDLAGREAFGHELADRLLGRGAGLAAGAVILPHLRRELVEEVDLLAQVDRRRLGARQRVPLRERCLLVEEFAGALLELEQVVGAVAGTAASGRCEVSSPCR